MNKKVPPFSYFAYHIQLNRESWSGLGLGEVRKQLLPAAGPAEVLFFRHLAQRLNSRRSGERIVSAGELNLYALLTRVYRHLIDRFTGEKAPGIIETTLARSGTGYGSRPLRKTIRTFVELFPPADVIDGKTTAAGFLKKRTAGDSGKTAIVRELILLSLAGENPAVENFREIMDDTELARTSDYRKLIAALDRELKKGPAFHPFGLTLMELLRAPIKASPGSLQGQIEYISRQWASALPVEMIAGLQVALDIVREEQRQWWSGGQGPAEPLTFGRGSGPSPDDHHYPEPENFSPDTNWMPNLVLMAKMVYVWLFQLSKRHKRPITRLDEIPDEELDRLAEWGFSGLWLIGIWERSPASRSIKHLSGNIDAISSAYSLYDYAVAEDLGGEEALSNLRHRALLRGIRLGCDMVPNHTGLYSKWILEHPDWYIQLDQPPYPAYRFTGSNLSANPDVSLFIEDGYWHRSDAAVVFKHVDNRTGRTRYIYHGNDGTSTPWNDTAQLNYLLPEVREAVIRTIIHVAKNFPIIRFDAAMTLAKKHYQRLWFPQPGHGGGVPSRAGHGLTRSEFDSAFPAEFWREVVDRVAGEIPDTLLLAEAFWLMEGYFVRTLGMHRVYNSAFMNMLRDEENARYRLTLKNVLEFNPEILKRFVNFMNNPDEKTAVEQFGREGKYFGTTVMLVTMPGLPMFGHGQVECLHEKYGMEYKRPYRDEHPDDYFVAMHRERIFPLMRRRRLFSGSDNFCLYDFYAGHHVDENVFAYSNMNDGERALVLYHNRYASTAGWVRTSVAIASKSDTGETVLIQKTLGEALALRNDRRYYYLFRDYENGFEYLRNAAELCEKGMYASLGAYHCQVFLDFKEIRDDDFGNWGKLCHRLAGRPVLNMADELKQVKYRKLIRLFSQLVSRHGRQLDEAAPAVKAGPSGGKGLRADLTAFVHAAAEHTNRPIDSETCLRSVRNCQAVFAAMLSGSEDSGPFAGVAAQFGKPEETAYLASVLFMYGVLSGIETAGHRSGEDGTAQGLLEETGLDRTAGELLSQMAEKNIIPAQKAGEGALLLKTLLRHCSSLTPGSYSAALNGIVEVLDDPAAALILKTNVHSGIEWFNKEAFEDLLFFIVFIGIAKLDGEAGRKRETAEALQALLHMHHILTGAAGELNYRLARLREFTKKLAALAPPAS